ncbi:hypothetical protein SERLA73DRAFT_180616 [Serpula lacrymans var. lacrymans S7.3]|uniref:Histone chaperone domain-containing protein n=1 Tax=Serpula lacrymans var. lacrymans (strain S7.3) TaxID=936435 RepID=F8PVP1_SERL3|nr:hypothetical protein SERLA73DRAFT_180616 [Serpula lacrymans var. lacrymans S7.3]
MSNEAGDIKSASPAKNGSSGVTASPVSNKGKGKVAQADESMDEEEEEEEDDDEEEEEDDDDDDMEEDEDGEPEVDPSAIISSGRRTRGIKVDYSSPAALAKAGLKPEDEDEDEDEEMK